MGRLFQIEYFKLRNARYFWTLMVLFAIFLLAVPIGAKIFMDYLDSVGTTFIDGFNTSRLPLFDFVDIWQNLTYIYKTFSIFLGFILVISVSNEFSYGTVKQNIIDGLSPKQFLLTKLSYIIGISAIFSLVALLIGLIMGMLWSPVKEISFITKNLAFIPAYCLHLIGFQVMCLFVALLIKRSGITIAIMIFYLFIIEPIVAALLSHKWGLDQATAFLPSHAMGNIIPNPYTKYVFKETQTTVGWLDTIILLVYAGLFYYGSYRLMTKRDIR